MPQSEDEKLIEEFDKLKKEFIAVKQNEWWQSDEDYIKSFLLQAVKNAREETAKAIIDEIPESIIGHYKKIGFSIPTLFKDKLKAKYLKNI